MESCFEQDFKFLKEIYKPFLLFQEQKAKQSNKNDKITVCLTEVNVIQYLVFGLSVISLPGLIVLYLVIPKIQIFTKLLYNLSNDWLENVVSYHSHLFSTRHYLYMSSW